MIIDGKKLADKILAELKKVSLREITRRVKILKSPQLTIGAILVGKNPASESFLKQKAKTAEILGMNFKIFRFKSNITENELGREIFKLNKNKKINGIIVQLPLPKHIKTEKILETISSEKDIDALSKNPKVLAPTVETVRFIFNEYKINLKNKSILIVGRGQLVGQPIYNWLININRLSSRTSDRQLMKIDIIDVKQKNQLPKLARQADIIISGVGKAGLINENIVKIGAILIDFGFSRKNGPPNGKARKIYGDFEFESCAKKAKIITPVPGGMGPIMVAMLFKNLFKLNKV